MTHDAESKPDELPDHEHRPVLNEKGKWEVKDGWGYSECFTEFDTESEAEAWIAGYDSGARANM